jgi:hypothetical protein
MSRVSNKHNHQLLLLSAFKVRQADDLYAPLQKSRCMKKTNGFVAFTSKANVFKQILTIFQYIWILASISSTPRNCLLKMSMELLLVRRLLMLTWSIWAHGCVSPASLPGQVVFHTTEIDQASCHTFLLCNQRPQPSCRGTYGLHFSGHSQGIRANSNSKRGQPCG